MVSLRSMDWYDFEEEGRVWMGFSFVGGGGGGGDMLKYLIFFI